MRDLGGHRDRRTIKERGKGPGGANSALAVALKEAGCSYASLRPQGQRTGPPPGRGLQLRQGVGHPLAPGAATTRHHTGVDRRRALRAARPRRVARGPRLPLHQRRPVSGRALVYGEDVAETLHTLAELGSTDISRRSLLGSVPFVAAALTNPQREWLLWLLEQQEAFRPTAVT